MEEDLKNLNEKLRRMYDVVKSDPNYMKHNYKASASAIQAMMKEQHEYKLYRPNSMDEEEEEANDWYFLILSSISYIINSQNDTRV